jgi:hypothetical protein
MSQVNHTWIDATSETVSKLPPVENGVQAKDQLDSTAVCERLKPLVLCFCFALLLAKRSFATAGRLVPP